MKLTKTNAQKIANEYSFGKVKKVKYLSEGYVNYNYLFDTTKGKYSVQIIGDKLDNWKKERMALQFKVLNHLVKTKFPYQVPVPVKSKTGGEIIQKDNKYLWAYPFIEGETPKKITKKIFQDIAKLTVDYHKGVSSLGILKDNAFYNGMHWLSGEYQKLKKVVPKNNLDKIMLRHVDLFENLLEQLKKIKYGKRLITHSDINSNNIILRDGKLVGLIDFDNIMAAPRAKDFAMALERNTYLTKNWSKRKQDIFLNEYNKHIPISKVEKKLIIPLILLENCGLFKWYYGGMEKRRDHAYRAMINMIIETKHLVKECEILG